MNERIKELFEQAHIQPPATRSGQFACTPPKTFSPEKFAEAIIRECCIALNPMLRDMISRGQGRELILQHFGINPKEITTFMLDRSIAYLEKQSAEEKKNNEVEL
jgi:hypothetical protein